MDDPMMMMMSSSSSCFFLLVLLGAAYYYMMDGKNPLSAFFNNIFNIASSRSTGTSSSKKGSSTEGGSSGGEGTNFTSGAAGASGSTNITFYGQNKADDNGEGMTGINLFKHGEKKLKFKNKPLFPGAVHQKHFGNFAYKVMEVKSPKFKAPVYLHIVDMCDSKDKVCNVNVKQNGKGFLVDVHATAFDAVGMKDGITTGTYAVVGEIRPSQLPNDVWMPKVASGKDSLMCSCTGTCTEKTQKWTTLKECK